MLTCGACKGRKVVLQYDGGWEAKLVRCERCGGDGLLPDPELQRLAKAVESLAAELRTIRMIAERHERKLPR